MIEYDFTFILFHISILLVTGLFFIIFKAKNKKQIHYVFLTIMLLLFIWNLGELLGIYTEKLFGYTSMFFLNIKFIGVVLVPPVVLLTGLIFAYTKIEFSKKYLLIFIIPLLSYIVLLTNKYHHLFFTEFSFTKELFGKYFMINTIYSYICIVIGLYFLIYFSIKNSGFFSKQSILIIIGMIVPFLINILYTFKIVLFVYDITSFAFSLAVICWAFAIFKFDFLNVVPIALQRVVDLISDSYVVLNENLDIIDYNKTLIDTFESIIKINRKDNFIEKLKSNEIFNEEADAFENLIRQSIDHNKPVSIEKHVIVADFDKHFTIEVTPIFSKDSFLGTIILFKDITEHKKNIQIIQETQNQLVEKERLASLGQLIGGIAHNLKTPIMSLSGGLEGLDDLIKEYDDSIDDKDVTSGDHHEIAKEMGEWIVKMKPYLSYMSDIITTVKDQAVQLNADVNREFTIDELVKRIDILMKHELKRAYCKLNMNINIDKNVIIKGEINNFIQVFNNLIVNAIHAYEGKGGEIDFNVNESKENIEFVIKDHGKGIAAEVKDKLFKEMVTTKGKNGTGLGLYMSYSTIKGKFGGDMRFESTEGKGTTFIITIPYSK